RQLSAREGITRRRRLGFFFQPLEDFAMVFAYRVRTVLALTVAAMALTAGTLWAARESAVSGAFKGNGKDAHLLYASAHKGEPLAGNATFVIVMSEKDHSRDKKPEINAGF